MSLMEVLGGRLGRRSFSSINGKVAEVNPTHHFQSALAWMIRLGHRSSRDFARPLESGAGSALVRAFVDIRILALEKMSRQKCL